MTWVTLCGTFQRCLYFGNMICFPQVLNKMFLLTVWLNPYFTADVTKDITIGIPQGSILGPFLLILYVSDLPCCLKKSNDNIFTGDTMIYSLAETVQSPHEHLLSDVINLHQCKLTVNVSKTNCMLLGARQKLWNCSHLELYINDQLL